MSITNNFDETGSGVTVNKKELLATLRDNLASHRKIFLEAQDGYRAEVVKQLDHMLRDAREGKQIRRSISLVEPEDHSKDYQRIIKMLEMSLKEEIKISETEFSRYVMDEWGWQKSFVASTSSYTGR